MEDDTVKAIRYDELIILYANHLCRKYRSQHNYNMIRARLRLLGRFLIKIKNLENSVTDFASIFVPKHYDSVVAALNARLNTDSSKYEAPTPAFQLDTILKQIGNIVISKCIKKRDEQKKKQVQDFLRLLEGDFATSVN
ncbi:hypothetical protein NQ314_001061 [Rhamnusium bicolor]|uniref:Uncharacterized protein n=1 Tax=Rhamnusium bicolor TaxID=1586634 RepID=A0AAV8ZWA4_9CUCU|nr:hypothetical protein NQ314_001061 [Rhamnusium bicolor]